MPMELDATVTAGSASPASSGQADPAPLDATATAAGSARARAAAQDHSVGPGTRLAHFRVERLLGEGGMGQVWLATDLALDRPVAVKVLPSDTAGDADRRDRLVREARAQARLVHPNVCHIYFIGEDEGRLFFAMEYVEGETLAARLARGPLPPDDALELTRMAAAGLRAADQAGFTHRDVKPSNLMIDRNGMLKVMDFGLVSASPDATVDGDAPVAASALVGTPLYMAPEQGRGEVVDRRADIYALGATLHHMISGAPPFAGETAADLMSRHQTEVRPRLSAIAPLRRSASLADDVVARMMAKRPADRYADYDQLLDAVARASTVHTRPAGMWVRGIAALLDLIAAALLVVLPMQLLSDVDDGVAIFAVWAFLYPIFLRRWGATPGRAALDLEVVRHDGKGRVGYVQAQTRFLVQYGPMALGSGLSELGRVLDVEPLRVGGIGLVMAGFLYVAFETLYASARSVDKRPRWDRVAGTRTCYRRRATSRRDDRKPA